MELTKSEMQIMDVLWASDVPLSRSDLLERSEEKTWKDSSVHILLNGLLAKGAIREVGFVKRSKTFGRTFLPSLSGRSILLRPYSAITISLSLSVWLRHCCSDRSSLPMNWMRLRFSLTKEK